MKVIIDTDPGTDDYLALIMALNSPELDIVGLTTVGGNTSLENTTRNALRLLEYMGRTDIPVARGASKPLSGEFIYAHHHHGPAGLTVRLPRPRISPVEQPAVDFIIDQAKRLEGDLTLVPIGPLTNIAQAFSQEPQLARWVKEIVIMGGAFEVPGNATPFAEFNIMDDPEAAAIVVGTGVPVKMIGLDVCNAVHVDAQDDDWFTSSKSGGKLAARVLKNWFKSRDGDAEYHLCDPLAIAALLQPGLVTYRQANVSVEIEILERRGKTTATYEDGNVSVAVEVAANAAKQFVKALLDR